VDDIASEILALRQIVFFVWVTLNEHKWVISRERRGGNYCLAVTNLIKRSWSPYN